MMKPPVFMTTSWDDGHPADLRAAALLAKYGIAGTFYVPAKAEREMMSAVELRELASDFEIGAHTLHHVDLARVDGLTAWREIAGSKSWVEDATGVSCACFCPPLGNYRRLHLRMIRKAGYLGMRSVEFLSLDFPRPRSGLLVMPTTVQAFPHRFPAFARNAIRRFAPANLWRYVMHGRGAQWPALAESLLRHAIAHGGVFHLWGHSWELQDAGQWRRLEELLRVMGHLVQQAPAVTNGQLCRLNASSTAVPTPATPAVKPAVSGG
jgi:peptidoglycan/xylan/chitin deacetylase (PgdA/CDA1 family)